MCLGGFPILFRVGDDGGVSHFAIEVVEAGFSFV